PGETPLAEPIRLALEPRTDFAGSKIGLGILRGEIHGKERIYHDGGTGGFTSSLVLTPETNGVQIVLANQANNYASQLATLLLQPEDGKSAMAEIVAKRDENPVPERPWTAYEGRYELNPQATFLVKEVDGRLYARLTGQVALPLEYAGNDTFVNESVGAWIAFVFEGEEDRKQANSLILNQAGRRMPAPLKKAAVETSLLLPEGVAQQYEGTYQLAPGADIKVTAKDRQLIVQLTGQQAIPVLPDGKDAFAYDVVEARIVFNRDEEGEVKSLTLFQNGREMKAPRKQS
ncbi:MAG: DUF3471 domain-containing protein, partial [Verrucomicrobia bacterium]|nr:DUF3471 domain-containing protein [Verrucomicrobiota bacterium]